MTRISLGGYNGIWAAGGGVATAYDIARFFEATLHGALIPEPSQEQGQVRGDVADEFPHRIAQRPDVGGTGVRQAAK